MKDLKEKTIRGGLARISAQVASFVLRIGSLMVLARQLSPKDFGLVGMATAFTGVLSLFRDFGLGAAAVQRSDVTDEQISNLFWVNVGFGIVLALVTAALAPAVVAFYHEPRLLWVTVVLAFGFFCNAIGVQHSAVLQRQMRFTALSVVNVVALALSSVAAIVLANAGYGYWALVAMTVLLPIVLTIGLWLTAAWVPRLPRKGVGLRSMLHFGGTITLNSVVVYIAYNLEKALLGRYWGADAIGIYGRAYQLVNVPTDNLNSAVGEVAFSALSRIQDDPQRLRSYFLKGYSLILSLTIPASIFCALYAPNLISILLGAKWKEAVPIFRLLAPTIAVFAMINPFSWILFAIGKTARSLKIAFVIAPLVITGYVLGLPYGPRGVAFGYSAAMALWLLPHIVWCVHGTAISVKDVMRTLLPPLISGGTAALLSFPVELLFAHRIPTLLRFAAETSVFASVYLSVLLFVMGQKPLFMNLVDGFRRREVSEGNAVSLV